MSRRKNEIIYNNPPLGLRASLVAAFVVGIIVWSIMEYFKIPFLAVVIYAYVIMTVGRTVFSSNRVGSRRKRRQGA